jgi:hypothetical protein
VDGGSGGPVDSGAISVTAGDLVFGAAGNSNSVAASWTAGGTSAGGTWAVVNTYNDVNHQVMSQYVVATATGSYSSFPTQASFTFCTSQVIQFKAPSVSAASVMLPMGMLGTGRV